MNNLKELFNKTYLIPVYSPEGYFWRVEEVLAKNENEAVEKIYKEYDDECSIDYFGIKETKTNKR